MLPSFNTIPKFQHYNFMKFPDFAPLVTQLPSLCLCSISWWVCWHIWIQAVLAAKVKGLHMHAYIYSHMHCFSCNHIIMLRVYIHLHLYCNMYIYMITSYLSILCMYGDCISGHTLMIWRCFTHTGYETFMIVDMDCSLLGKWSNENWDVPNGSTAIIWLVVDGKPNDGRHIM